MVHPFLEAIDYCAVTYHPMLTKDQSDRLEKLQSRALKSIYGWDKSYEKVRELSGLKLLSERREKMVLNFANKSAKNERFGHRFPKIRETGHDIRNLPLYQEDFSRTERYRQSPVNYMRRMLNQLHQKTY